MPIQNDEQARKIARAIADPSTPPEDRAGLRAALQAYDDAKTQRVEIQLRNGQKRIVEIEKGFTPADVDYIAEQLEAQAPSVHTGRYNPADPSFQAANAEVGRGIGQGLMYAPQALGQGTGQLAGWLGEKAGVISPQENAAYDAAVIQDRAKLRERGGSPLVADLAAGLVPIGGVAGSAKILPKLKYVGQALKAALSGGAAAGFGYTEDGTNAKPNQMAVGAALGGAVQSVMGAIPAATNAIKVAVDKARTARTSNVVAQAEDFFRGSKAVPEPAPYTLGQETGSARVTQLEQQARGTELNELNARQLDETSARFRELAATARAALTPAKIVASTHEAVNGVARQMKSIRSNAWKADEVKLESLSKASRPTIDLSNFRKTLDEMNATADNPLAVFTSAVKLPKAQELAENLNQAYATMRAPRFKASFVGELLKGVQEGAEYGAGALNKTPDDIKADMWRGRLRDALDSDVAAAGATKDAAVIQLRDMRKRYAKASAAIDGLADNQLNKLFGDKAVLQTPDTALKKFFALGANDQDVALKVLGQRAPAVLDGMRGQYIANALDAATENTAAKVAQLNVSKFNDAMFGGANGLKGSRLFDGDPKLKQRLLEGAAHIRVLQNNLGTGAGTLYHPAELAANVVSLSAIFGTRTAVRVAYGVHGDKLLGTPEGLKALRTLKNVGRATPQALAAAVSYVSSLASDDPSLEPDASAQ